MNLRNLEIGPAAPRRAFRASPRDSRQADSHRRPAGRRLVRAPAADHGQRRRLARGSRLLAAARPTDWRLQVACCPPRAAVGCPPASATCSPRRLASFPPAVATWLTSTGTAAPASGCPCGPGPPPAGPMGRPAGRARAPPSGGTPRLTTALRSAGRRAAARTGGPARPSGATTARCGRPAGCRRRRLGS